MSLGRFKKLSYLSYLSIVLTIFSTTMLIEYFTVTSQTDLMINEAKKRAAENVSGFAKIIVNPTLEKDYSGVIDIFNAIAENKKIVQISLLDTNGISKITVRQNGNTSFDKKKYDTVITNKHDEQAHLITSVAAISTAGYLMIHTSTVETEEITENAIINAIAIATILSLMAIVFNIFLLKKPLKELEDLGEFAVTIPFNYGLNAPDANSTYELKALSTALTDASHQIYEQKSELEAMNSELTAMNEGLRDMVDEQTEKIMEHERLLVQQSKMAAMGDMIGAIAHQWRQPLNALAIAVQDIKFAHESGELDGTYISNMVKSSMGMINFMSGTIEDFRNFFKPAKEKNYFSAASVVKSVLSILGTQLENHDIKLTVEGGDFRIFGYSGELSQVILNLISNSKDAILGKKEHTEEWINIHINPDGIISVCDSGGGVPDDLQGRIFEPYFTTKEQGKGTGIGLYMSKLIVEKHMDGSLTVENTKDGACFRVCLSFSENKM